LFRVAQQPRATHVCTERAAAHADSAMEQTATQRARLQDRHARRSRGLAHDRDVARITAEARDIALDPLQRRDLIEESVVAGRVLRRFGSQLGMREKAERADAIRQRDVDDALLRELFAVVVGHRSGADRETAPVDPDHDRHSLRAGSAWWRPDVQIEAILAGRLLAEVVVDVMCAQRLNAFRRCAIGVIRALPRRHRLRRTPAQLANRRRCERHAKISVHAGCQLRSCEAAGVDGDRISGNCLGRAERARGCECKRHAQCCNVEAASTYHAGGSGRVDLLCTYQFVNTITRSPLVHASSQLDTPANPALATAGRTHARFAILALLTVGTLINYLDRTVISVAAPLLSHDLGLSAVAMGVVFSAFSWTYAAAQIPGGIVLDRIGVRLTYFLSVTIWSGFTLLQGLTTNLWTLIACRMGLGVAEAPAFPSNSRILGTR